MGSLTKQLVIFEGPDGSGKTTAAKQMAERLGARYVHFSSLPRVSAGLARMYVEAMLPALLGYQTVVFDRSWLSEIPYGMAYREGHDRLGDAARRMLERLALRCGAVVVKADPGWETVASNFAKRKHLEMLDNHYQLAEVYMLYNQMQTDLPVIPYDYREGSSNLDLDLIQESSSGCHDVDVMSAGNLAAIKHGVVLVGQDFAERKDQDPFYQWPFASFNRAGCSQWLAEVLERAEISEADLFWINADQNLRIIEEARTVVALGGQASTELSMKGIKHITVAHPQHQRRFGGSSRYELINILRERII